MKSFTIILTLVLSLISLESNAQNIPSEHAKVVEKFTAAVSQHNMKKVFKSLDKEYRKEQLDFLQGDKDQLINELFGGEDPSEQGAFIVVKLEDIESIEIAEVIPLKGGDDCTYIFKLKVGDKEILSSLLLSKNGKKYGFVGAMG